MTVREIVDTLDEIVEKRPINPDWWENYGNKAVSLTVMIIGKWQELTPTDDWVDLIIDLLGVIAEQRPANPDWWNNRGNEAVSSAVLIIEKWQKLTSTDDWRDVEKIEQDER